MAASRRSLSVSSLLAHWQGERVLAVLQSDWFEFVIAGLAVVAVGGTVASAVILWKRTRGPATPASGRNARQRQPV